MLLDAIDRHLRATGMSATRFGREAAGDPRLVFDLRRGRQPGLKIRMRIHAIPEGTTRIPTEKR